MLTSLANNVLLAAGVSQTFTYSPYSLQKVFVHLEDSSGTDSWAGTMTVQIGSRTILNGADIWGLVGQTILRCGVGQSGTDAFVELDFGSHQMLNNDNVYVTLNMSAAVSAVDVSLIVDEPGTYNPLSITEYSDNTFTSQNVLSAINFSSAEAAVDEDSAVCEVKTNIYSSAPTFISANSYFASKTVGGAYYHNFGLLTENTVPLNTTFNYSASATTDRILVVSAMPRSQQARLKAMRSGRVAMANVSARVK